MRKEHEMHIGRTCSQVRAQVLAHGLQLESAGGFTARGENWSLLDHVEQRKACACAASVACRAVPWLGMSWQRGVVAWQCAVLCDTVPVACRGGLAACRAVPWIVSVHVQYVSTHLKACT